MRLLKSLALFVVSLVLTLVGPTSIVAQDNLGWGAICNQSGSPFPNFSPNLVGLGPYPNNPYTAVDISGTGSEGCSWKLQPFSENVYRTPEVNVVATNEVGYSFWANSPVAQSVILTLIANSGANQYTINLDLNLTGGGQWEEIQFIWDGGTNDVLDSASMAFVNPDGNENVLVDNISIAFFEQVTATPSVTPTPTTDPSTPTPTPTGGVCSEEYATSFISCTGGPSTCYFTWSGLANDSSYVSPSGSTSNILGDGNDDGLAMYINNPGGAETCLTVSFGSSDTPQDVAFYWRVSNDDRGINNSAQLDVLESGGWTELANFARNQDGWYEAPYSGTGFTQARVCSIKNTTGVQGYPHIDAFRRNVNCGVSTPTSTPTNTPEPTATPTETRTPLPVPTTGVGTSTPNVPTPEATSTFAPTPNPGGGTGTPPGPGDGPGFGDIGGTPSPVGVLPDITYPDTSGVTRCVVVPDVHQVDYWDGVNQQQLPDFPGTGLAQIGFYFGWLGEFLYYLWSWIVVALAWMGNILIWILNIILVGLYGTLGAYFHAWYLIEVVVTFFTTIYDYAAELATILAIDSSDAPATFQGSSVSSAFGLIGTVAAIPYLGDFMTFFFGLAGFSIWVRAINNFIAVDG